MCHDFGLQDYGYPQPVRSYRAHKLGRGIMLIDRDGAFERFADPVGIAGAPDRTDCEERERSDGDG
jgi:hypothetical protein